ncbi:MAG TPA: TetR/AcrR family transcriptional regulator [Candidatus Acidoferrales bacterium]|nr:TetR/AcrR family transcriptional regulator [Candidatus Acidoferrales bacterium]
MPQKPKAKRRPAPRTPQQARSRRTRQVVLDAAVACFEANGYDETTTAAIARKAGIAVGTLYVYFHDKRAILLELLEGTTKAIGDYVVQSLDPALWRHSDPRQSVRRLIDALFHIRTFNPGMQRILWERYFKDSEFRMAVQAIERRVRVALVDLFKALRSDGRLRVTDTSTAAFLVYASIEWTASRLMLEGGEAESDAAVAAASDMVSRFLFKD